MMFSKYNDIFAKIHQSRSMFLSPIHKNLYHKETFRHLDNIVVAAITVII